MYACKETNSVLDEIKSRSLWIGRGERKPQSWAQSSGPNTSLQGLLLLDPSPKRFSAQRGFWQAGLLLSLMAQAPLSRLQHCGCLFVCSVGMR